MKIKTHKDDGVKKATIIDSRTERLGKNDRAVSNLAISYNEFVNNMSYFCLSHS